MAQAIINFKTDAKLKSDTKKVLDAMGLNFSIAFNEYMRTIIEEKRIEFRVPHTPSARLKQSIKQAEQEVKKGKVKVFTRHEDFEKDLLG